MRRLATLLLGTLAACDVPTRAPQWDVEWNVPSSSTRISIASLLPPSVTVNSDTSAFQFNIPTLSVTEDVATACPACGTGVLPKPAFTMSMTASTSLPSEVLSATIANDTLQFTVVNNLSYDPLNPSAAPGAAKGWSVIVVRNGTTILGRDSVNGATTALPSGGTVVRRIALAGTVSSSSPITFDGTIYSPAGDPVTFDPSQTVSVTAATPTISVSSASIALSNTPVAATATSFDLTGMSSDVIDRIQSGALILTITNPVAVGGTLNVNLTTPGATLVRSVSVSPGGGAGMGVGTSSRVSFTRDELRSLFGQTVGVQVAGSMTAPSGSVTLTPRQVIDVTTRLDVILNTSTTGGN